MRFILVVAVSAILLLCFGGFVSTGSKFWISGNKKMAAVFAVDSIGWLAYSFYIVRSMFVFVNSFA